MSEAFFDHLGGLEHTAVTRQRHCTLKPRVALAIVADLIELFRPPVCVLAGGSVLWLVEHCADVRCFGNDASRVR